MKKILLAVNFIAAVLCSEAQIGLGVTTPHPNAYFQINSTNKGVLLPRMTAVQRLAIAPAATANGLIVFDTDSTAFMYWSGSAWLKLSNSNGAELWKQNGSHIYNGNSGNVGIGTPFFFTPAAKLHVLSGSVLFSKDFPAESSPANPPASGQGRRMMWYSEKAAMRSGYVSSTSWDKDSIGNYSFACGYDTKAKGEYSFATGYQVSATGLYAGSMGWNNAATGQAAFASGMYNTASGGFGALATGFNNIASGNASFTTGSSGTASGDGSFTAGSLCTASASGAFAGGYSSVASGQNGLAFGNAATASGVSSASLGTSTASSGQSSFAANSNNTASGNSSAAFGYNSVAKAFGGFAIGTFNDDTDSPDPNVEAPSDKIFQVGNGFFNVGFPIRQDALTVLRNGNVGIGNSSPNVPLEFAAVHGKKISFYPIGAGDCGIGLAPNLLQFYTPYNFHDLAFGISPGGVFSETVRITGNGNVGIGVTNPVSPLAFASTTGQKISFWGNDLINSYGIGVQGGLLQLHAAFAADNIGLGFGSSSNFTERVRVQGNGNVGIGNINPGYILDVNNRMRIRSGGDFSNTAGVWFNRTDNAALQAFVGIETDNTVGFYGSSSGWSFTMNTNTGKVKIADGTQAAGRILSSDANGVASWVNSTAITSAVTGIFAGGGTNLTTSMGAAYLNTYIDLPPGKWIVLGTYLMSQGGSGGAMLAGQSMWVRTFFSSSNVANIPTGDIIGSGLMSGSVSYPSPYAVINGQNIINNTSGATKRYYVWGLMSNTGGQPAGFSLDGLGSNFWSENQLTAVPMN